MKIKPLLLPLKQYVGGMLLSANRDPVAKILGDRFATISGTDYSAYRFVEEIMRSAPATGRMQAADDNAEQDSDVDEKKMELRLLMLLKDFDDKLLQEAIRVISS